MKKNNNENVDDSNIISGGDKPKPSFNIIDIAILGVIAIVLVIGIRFLDRNPGSVTTPTTTVQALAEITWTDLNLLERITPGDEIYLTVDNVDKAVVVDVALKPTIYTGFDQETQTYKETQGIGDSYTGYITIQAQAREDDANFYVGTTSLKVGAPIFIKGKGYSARAFILEMDVVEGGAK